MCSVKAMSNGTDQQIIYHSELLKRKSLKVDHGSHTALKHIESYSDIKLTKKGLKFCINI